MRRSSRVAFVMTSVGLAALGLLGPVPSAQASTIIVTSTGDDNPEGPSDGDCTLREAIASANFDSADDACAAGSGPDVIVVPPGTYALSVTGAPDEDDGSTGDLDILGDLSIAGAGPGTTVITGSGLDRVFEVDPASSGIAASISGLTVRDGKTSESFADGGGILNRGKLEVVNVAVVQNDSASLGGGIENDGSGAQLTMIDSVVSGNVADSDGGGIANESGGTISLSGVTISGNVIPTLGAGLATFSGTVNLTNVTVTGNVTDEEAGGVGVYGGTTTLSNATVTDNTADSDGTGTNDDGGGVLQDPPGVLIVRNSVVAGNHDGSPADKSPDCFGSITSQGHNLIGSTADCTFMPTTGDKTGVDPLLGPPADNGGPTMTHALLPGSPAIDAGDPAGCPTTDQRGAPRSACDMGAYELVNCFKRPVIEVGTEGNDVMTGTGAPEVFLALGGKDKVNGKGGGDRICGGKGKDALRGGAGKDRLAGEQGRDVCIGGGGRDKARSCEKERTIP